MARQPSQKLVLHYLEEAIEAAKKEKQQSEDQLSKIGFAGMSEGRTRRCEMARQRLLSFELAYNLVLSRYNG